MVPPKHLMAPDFMEKKIQEALESVKRLLDVNRDLPVAAKDAQHHSYMDKYQLCELSTNMCVCAVVNCLFALGMSEDKLRTMVRWVKEDRKRVSLAFRCDETCAFKSEVSRDVEDPTRCVLACVRM